MAYLPEIQGVESESIQPSPGDSVSAEGQAEQFELRRRLVQMEMLYEVGLALERVSESHLRGRRAAEHSALD